MPVKLSVLNRRGSGEEGVPPDSRGGPGRPQTTVVYQMPHGPPQLSRVAGTGAAQSHSYGYGVPPPQGPYHRAIPGGALQQSQGQYHAGPPTAQSDPGTDRRFGPSHERYVERMEEDPRPHARQGRIIREISRERLSQSAPVRGSAPPPEGSTVVYETYDPSEERVTYVRQGVGVPVYQMGQGQYEIVHRVSSSPSTSPGRGDRDSYGPGRPTSGPSEALIARGRSFSANSSETVEPRSSPSRRPGSVPAQAGPQRESDAHHPHVMKRTIAVQNGSYPSHESSASLDSQRMQTKVLTSSVPGPHELRRVAEGSSFEVRPRAHEHLQGEQWREEGHPPQYAQAYEHHPRTRQIGENPPPARSSPGRYVYNVASHPSHPGARTIRGEEYNPVSRQYYYEDYQHARHQHDGPASHRVTFERDVDYLHHRQQDPHYHQRQRPMVREEVAGEHQPPPPPLQKTAPRMVMRTILGVNNTVNLPPEKESTDSVPMTDHGIAPTAPVPSRSGVDVGESASKSAPGKTSSDTPGDDPVNMGCTCKKSKCLKLYCQCFASKQLCGPNCRCLTCMNTLQYEQVRKDAINTILARNPNAFDTKFKATLTGAGKDGDSEEGQTKVAHKLGCKCRKSACLKKYCECYHANVKCSTNCRCVGCQNMPPGGPGGPGGSKKSENKMETKIESKSPEPTMNDAIQQLTSLKNASAESSDCNSSSALIKDMPPVSLLTSGELETSVNDPPSSCEESKMEVDDQSKSGNEQKSDKIISASPNTEKKASEGVNTLLMAAFAMTEMHKGNTPPVSPTLGPKKEPDNSTDMAESPPRKPAEITQQETPEQRFKKAPFRSPKRKSSEDSSDDSTDNGSRKKYHYSPESATRELSRHSSSPTLNRQRMDSCSDDDAMRTHGAQQQKHGPRSTATPEQRKVKRSRLGSVKKKKVHPFLLNESAGSASCPDKASIKADPDERMSLESKYGSPDRIASQKLKENHVECTPKRSKEMKEVLTPVSARCVELRQMEVNPDSGRRVGFDLEKEGRV
mmetsp:Transcript_24213/g.35566  ORF Transcript_24213/g.35566 Transcript_24213/m.35566 type:complete len:1025 (-) Transcript_24213:247-3321(-)